MKRSPKKSGKNVDKSSEDTKSSNQGKVKQRRIWILLESTIVTALLLGSMGYFWNTYTAFRSTMFDKYDKLIKSIELLVFMDENLFLRCEERKRVALSDCACKYDLEILNYRKDMFDQFEKVTDGLRSLGKFIPYENYLQVKQLGYWSNQVIISKKGMCDSGLLVDTEKMDKWRHSIINNLIKEKTQYRKLLYSLEAYVINILTFRSTEMHVSAPVDLKSLPIYQNS